MSYKYNVTGEFSFLFSTKIHKGFKYPQFQNEKFMKESLVINRIFEHNQLLFINVAIAEAEYLDDGLSFHFKEHLNNSPKGISLAHQEKMNNIKIPFYNRLEEAKAYWDYESIHNRSFFSKINKIKSFKLRYHLLIFKIKKII